MKTFRDLKTSTLFVAGFGVLISAMLAISVVAWQQTNQMAQQTEQLYNHSLQVRRALGLFETSVNAIHRDMRGLMFAENELETEAMLSILELSETEAFRQLKILESQYLGSASDITKLREEFVKWNSIRKETIRLLREGNADEAADRTKPEGVGGVQAQQLFKQTYIVDVFSRNNADRLYADAMELNADLNHRLLLFTVSIIILSILMSIILIRLINAPLAEMTRAVNAYRSGNKASRSGYSSLNQFGVLSDSFNEMADELELENKIAKNVTELSRIMLSEIDAQRFCMEVLKNLTEHTNSQMGAVYLLNTEQTMFERFACLGMSADGCKPFSAIHPEGEFGLALASSTISHIKDIPSDSRFSFAAVAGDFKPREIITIPIYNHSQAVALISVFSLHCYSDVHLRVVENIFDTLTARMNGILAHKQMLEFSQQLEVQNRELDAQSKELTSMTDELKVQNAELEIQKYQLGEVSRLKSNFLSNMSHELRTPLNSVIALSGVLNRRLVSKIGEEEYSYLGVIERNGRHLLDLINNVLDLSRIEAGKVELEKNSFEMTTLLNEVIAMIHPQANVKGVGLTLKESTVASTLESDYTKCFHIFQNIIGNAVKFTEEGQVEVEVSEHNGKLMVKVSDTGIGISKADLPHIFDEFRQADGSNSRKFEGTGLGLSIAKKYADLIHCTINVSSEPGKGTTFTVIFPLTASYPTSDDTTPTAQVDRQWTPVPSPSPGGGKKIVLVEDTEAMVVQICDVLEAEGYEVETARNGLEALELLEKNIPDAMILDVMMPGMDGIELLNTIRSRNETAYLPVLVLTAKILSKEEKDSIKNNHIHQLIQKGAITQDKLLEAVATMLLNKGVQ